jgi:eukaryotic-like serine/threonine-protein kinase
MPTPQGESDHFVPMTLNLSPHRAGPPLPSGPDELTLVGGRGDCHTTTPFPLADRFPRLPGYAIVCELGRGGMGVVYRATQDRLNRTVAVKTLLHHDAPDVSDVVRFRSEAEAVAAIAHPHVVKVFESGQHEGRSYFAMEYLPGGTLHAKLRAKAPFSPDESAALVEKLARAVHAAHCLGIVHRDLKPGNVLFDAAGEPRVTDFGLAKRTSHELTRTQAVMGTPAYMPPEQAAGRAKYVGPPADIYALGVILYECLTGATPFGGDDSLALLNQVIADEPPSIRSKRPLVSRDLELICFKCLEKGPADRYQSAAELADDLRRFIAREPVSVRPAGLVEKAVKWAKRRPTLATAYALGVLAAALLLFGGGAAVLAVQTAWARDEANLHWRTAEVVRDQLQRQAGELEKARDEADEHRLAAEQVRDDLAAKHEEVGNALGGERRAKEALEKEHKALVATREELELTRYFRNVVFAHREALAGHYQRAADLLDDCPPARRGWEWHHAYRTAHTDVGSGYGGSHPLDAAYEPGGKSLITSHIQATVIRFEYSSATSTRFTLGPEGSSLRLSANGRRAVAVRGWDRAHDDAVTVWDVATGKRLAAFPGPHAPCHAYALSPDGKRVVFQYQKEPVCGYEVDTGEPLGRLDCQLATFSTPKLSADGGVAACPTDDGAVVWDVTSGKELRRVKGESGVVKAVGVSPDGKTVVTGTSAGEVRVHPADGKPLTTPRAHVGGVRAIACSPDNTRAITGGDDGTLRVWDLATGGRVQELHGHVRPVTAITYHSKGDYVVSTETGSGFRMWAVNNMPKSAERMPPPPQMKRAFACRADFTRVFAAGDGELGTEWHPAANQVFPLAAAEGTSFTAAAVHPTSQQKALGSARGEVYLQADPNTVPKDLNGLPDRVRLLRYSADGTRLVGVGGKLVRVWDTADGKLLFQDYVDPGGTAAISADGTRVAVTVVQGLVAVHHITPKKAFKLSLSEHATALAFTPDGKGLVVGTRDWGVAVHPLTPDAEGNLPADRGRRYVGHSAPVTSFGFSPDGKRLASGAADGQVRVWDVVSGHEAICLTVGVKEAVTDVWFTPDGLKLAAQPETGPPWVFDGSVRPETLRGPRPDQIKWHRGK